MPTSIDVFFEPIRDSRAQTAVIALCVLALFDVLFGVGKAIVVNHDFSSHAFRIGILRKLSNLGIVVAADVVDAMLLGGLELGFQPVLITATVSLALMELWSLLEHYAELHPEISDAPWYQMLVGSKGANNGEQG